MIRDCKTDDLEAVLSVFKRSVREIANRDYSPAQINAWAPESVNLRAWSKRLAGMSTFVCERNSEIVGFTSADDRGYIDLLYVHPEHERQGIARALLEHVVSWGSNQGIHRLKADVSITARPFFETMGFHMVTRQSLTHRGITFLNFRMERDVEVERLKSETGFPLSRE